MVRLLLITGLVLAGPVGGCSDDPDLLSQGEWGALVPADADADATSDAVADADAEEVQLGVDAPGDLPPLVDTEPDLPPVFDTQPDLPPELDVPPDIPELDVPPDIPELDIPPDIPELDIPPDIPELDGPPDVSELDVSQLTEDVGPTDECVTISNAFLESGWSLDPGAELETGGMTSLTFDSAGPLVEAHLPVNVEPPWRLVLDLGPPNFGSTAMLFLELTHHDTPGLTGWGVHMEMDAAVPGMRVQPWSPEGALVDAEQTLGIWYQSETSRLELLHDGVTLTLRLLEGAAPAAASCVSTHAAAGNITGLTLGLDGRSLLTGQVLEALAIEGCAELESLACP